MEMILSEIGRDKGEQIVTFGDGPVEMRATWRVGGVRVGVASDEKKRFNINPRKRERLILGGAQIVIPDFSQYRELMRLIF